MNKIIIKQGNTNGVNNNVWISLLFELLLDKKILLNLLKNISIPDNCTIEVFKKDSVLSHRLSTFFDVYIKIINNNNKKTQDIFIVIDSFKSIKNTDNSIPISVYRNKDKISIEDIVYSSTNKRAKIVFSYFKKCDRKQVYARYISNEDLMNVPFYILNNLEIPFDKYIEILYNRLSKNKNKIVSKILNELIKDKEIKMEEFICKFNINKVLLNKALSRMLKRFSYLKRYLEISDSIIKVKVFR